jgi:DNA-binding Lrp family transcriptional regulator
MELLDRKILNLVQRDFPLAPNPFAVTGKALGVTEAEVIKRLKRMKSKKLIRRIGSTLNTGRLGMASTLIALHVPKQKINKTALIINACGNVTHNYLRRHYYNIWFTLTARTKQELVKIIKSIKKRAGINEIMDLPARTMFKREVIFKF